MTRSFQQQLEEILKLQLLTLSLLLVASAVCKSKNTSVAIITVTVDSGFKAAIVTRKIESVNAAC